MRGVMRVFGGLFRFFGRLIFTPILLGWMIGAVLFGAMIGALVATPFVFAFFVSFGLIVWHIDMRA